MKAYQDTVGLTIVLDTDINLSGATALTINVRKPDGTEESWTGAAEGLDQISYDTVSGDLDQEGVYLLQAVAQFGTDTFSGETLALEVFAPYA